MIWGRVIIVMTSVCNYSEVKPCWVWALRVAIFSVPYLFLFYENVVYLLLLLPRHAFSTIRTLSLWNHKLK